MTGHPWQPPERDQVLMGAAELQADGDRAYVVGTPLQDAAAEVESGADPGELGGVQVAASILEPGTVLLVACPYCSVEHNLGRVALPARMWLSCGRFVVVTLAPEG